jgi:spectinomycin phosphotransferase
VPTKVLTHVLTYVAEDFAIHLTSADPVDGGVDRAAQNFRARTADGTTYAVKWSSGGSAAGLVVPHSLSVHGTRGLAAPVPTSDGRLWSERDGRRLSVTPWVGERVGIDGGLDAAQWRALGEVLAATHALPLTPGLSAVLPVANHLADLASARAVDAMLREATPSDAIAEQVQELWFAHADRTHAAAAHVEALVPAVTPTAVCHTDPHLGNVLAAPGELWLIDWDDAALSTPEHDLMFVLGGTYGDEHIGERERSWFFEGYGQAPVDPLPLSYWRASRALCDLAFLAEEAFRAPAADSGPAAATAPAPADPAVPSPAPASAWRTEALTMATAALAPTGLLALAMS